MHLIQNYALTAGQKISKIDVMEKFIPLPAERFILYHGYSKPIKNYSYHNQVIDIIFPVLDKLGIKIIQVGNADEPPIKNCIRMNGSTNINQLKYLIRHSLLVISPDSVTAHLASACDIPLVDIIVNNYESCVGPFFGSKEKQIIITPPREENEKPVFAYDEQPRSIDRIAPESIAAAIFKLLNIEYSHPYKTLFFGETFKNPVIESVPNCVINPQSLNLQNLIVRCDYEYNEQNLANQLNLCNCTIVTNKPINIQLLKQFAPRISQLYYILGKDHDLNFIKELNKTPIKYVVFSHESEEFLQTLKLDYYKHCVVHPKKIAAQSDIKELKDKNLDNVFFKSNKFTLSNGLIFPSRLAYLQKKPIQNLECPWLKFEDNIEMWKEIEYFYLTEKVA